MARNNKEKGKNDHLIEGSIMLGIGIVFMLILVGAFGKAGKAVTDFFVGSFGYAVYAYFLALIIFGILTICKVKRPKMSFLRVLSLLMFFAMVIALLHCVSSMQYTEDGYGKYLSTCYNEHNTAGGVVAGVFLYPLLLANYVGIVVCSIFALAFGGIFVFYDSIISYWNLGKKKEPNPEMVDFRNENGEDNFEIVESNLYVDEDTQGGKKKKGKEIAANYVPLDEASTTSKINFEKLVSEDSTNSRFARLKDRNLLNVEPAQTPVSDKKSDFDNAYNILYGNNKVDEKKQDKQESQSTPVLDKEDYESYTNEYRIGKINDNLNGKRENNAVETKKTNDYFEVDNISIEKSGNNEQPSIAEILSSNKREERFTFNEQPREIKEDTVEDDGLGFLDRFGKKSEQTEDNPFKNLIKNEEQTISFEKIESKPDYDNMPVEDKTATHKEVDGFESLLKRQREERERIAKEEVSRRHNLQDNTPDEEEILKREQKRKERSDKGGTHISSKPNEEIKPAEITPVKPTPVTPVAQPIQPVQVAKVETPKEEVKKEKARVKLAPYKYPPFELLKNYESKPSDTENFDDKIAILETTLSEFGIDAKVNRVVTGPTFSRLELVMPRGIPVKRVLSYVDDIAMCLEVKSVRCQIPIPGKNAFGVEIPNEKRGKVGLKSVIQSDSFTHNKHKLAFAVGQNCDGENFTADLSAMPHLLIAGATGAGKSVCLNSLIVSLLYKYTPEELRLLLVDPKQVELNMYNKIPHMLIPEAVSDKDKTLNLLDWAIEEMEMRYTMFKDRRVQKITDYNATIDPKKEDKLPYIVIIIDEVGDFMMVMKKELEERIVRLTQKARAAGIHLILATQRPSVDVITGTIKANLPARIAFAVASFTDSKTILDQGGAEKLLRYGDMIFSDGVNEPVRLQGTLIEGEEVNAICDYVRDNNECYFDKDIEEYILNTNNNAGANAAQTTFGESSGEQDDLFVRALYNVVTTGAVSISKLQRKFGIGFPRAARLVDTMEELGYIGAAKDNKQREILIDMPTLRAKYGDVSLE